MDLTRFNEFDGAFYNNDPIVDLNEDGEIYVGKLYTNKTELKNVVGRFALKMNFEFMVKKSGTDVFYATCRGSDWKWRVRGRKRACCDMFEVTVFHNEHTCSLDSRHADNRQERPWKNPGTITDIITEDNRFKYCFWSLAACRRGFKFCRPVISIDGTFLKTRFGGTMLVAVAYDANNQLFLIAFAIVDSENHDSWKYFLQKLKEAIGEVENLVFVSDRHQSIEHAVEVIFPEACHCACYKHISMNVTHKFKTDVCNTQIWLAAYAWSKRECDRHLRVLRRMDPPIAAYVDNIGLEKWARPYCLGDRFTLQNWFANRLEKASKCVTPLATHFEEDLIKQHEDGRRRSVLRNGAQLFNVGRGVDGSDFEKGGDPQPLTQNVSVYALSSPYYTKETWKNTYDATINVVGEEDEWVLPEHMQNMRIGVPKVEKKPVGRPRKSNAKTTD
ncbi:uncharacterized protein LOC115710825 [Cannabis sativa]|uniref:uncharacterized protein LOC115710825 n=1 Tax=Cannabis sativa TaxID=3483 RepID=UPI0029C9E9E1|nr:uncharacterized protein LOC115710825 [Cannabis sativa]